MLHCAQREYIRPRTITLQQSAMYSGVRGLVRTAMTSLRHFRPIAASPAWSRPPSQHTAIQRGVTSATAGAAPPSSARARTCGLQECDKLGKPPVCNACRDLVVGPSLTFSGTDAASARAAGPAHGLPGAPKLILGIESSCDDTGVAIVSSDGRILGEALATQVPSETLLQRRSAPVSCVVQVSRTTQSLGRLVHPPPARREEIDVASIAMP